jgi:hypothetical protein
MRVLSRIPVLRLATHVAIWLPFVIGVIRAAQRGQVVIADGAAIAFRSWDVLTPYGSLVGQATALHNGAFDPGPLQYWLLAIPVHINPRVGVVWGAALWSCVAGSLAIEAARSAFGRFGMLAAAGSILGIVTWNPLIAALPYWNPWLGIMFFLATLAAGMAVVSGRRRWWPVLVVTASVAAQNHLMFALASAAVVLLALVAGLIDTIRARAGYRWVFLGLILGAACWIAPFIQQFTSHYHNGNLSLLISSLGVRKPAGTAFALKALSASAMPPPVWWEPWLSFRREGIVDEIGGMSTGFGVAVLVVTAVALILAIRPLRSRRLAALATVSLLTSGAVLATYTNIPVQTIGSRAVNYLLIVLFPAGVLAWLVAGSAVVLVARRVIHRVGLLAAARAKRRYEPRAPAAAETVTAGGTELASADAAEAASTDATDVASTDATELGSTDAIELGSTDAIELGSTDARELGSTDATEPASAEATEVASTDATEPASADVTEPGSTEVTEPVSLDAALPGITSGTEPGTLNGTEPETLNGTEPGRANGTGPGRSGGTAVRWDLRAAGVAALALLGLGSWLGVVQQRLAAVTATPPRELSITSYAAQRIEQLLPPQRLMLSVRKSSGVSVRDLTLGVAWALHVKGYQPAVNHRSARYLGPRYQFRGRPMTHVTVIIRHRETSVQIIVSGGTPQR